MEERLKQISRCMEELAVCRRQLSNHEVSDPLLPLLGQMDWLYELHTQLYV